MSPLRRDGNIIPTVIALLIKAEGIQQTDIHRFLLTNIVVQNYI